MRRPNPGPPFIVSCLTAVYFVSWFAFLTSVSSDGYKSFFTTSTLREALREEFQRRSEDCFYQNRQVSVTMWRKHVIGKYSALYLWEIEEVRDWVRMRGGDGVEDLRAVVDHGIESLGP